MITTRNNTAEVAGINEQQVDEILEVLTAIAAGLKKLGERKQDVVVNVPEIKMADVRVNVPEIKVPGVNIPETIVNVAAQNRVMRWEVEIIRDNFGLASKLILTAGL